MAETYQAPYAEPSFEPPAPKKQTNTVLIIVIVLLLLCCCCLGVAAIFYFWLGDIILNSIQSTGSGLWLAASLMW